MSHRISSETVVVRARWARLKHCDVRSAWLFLVPERVLFPCPISVEILRRIERPRSIGDLAHELAQEYDASDSEIEADITGLIDGFVEKGYVRRIAG